MIGVIGGTPLADTELFKGGKRKVVETNYGKAEVVLTDKAAFIKRHGMDNIPPHIINHKANIYALNYYVKKIVGVGSVGSLKKTIKPPAIVVPDDYINSDPLTYMDDKIVHITPGFDEKLREKILNVSKDLGIKASGKGVYVQTRGPRLETKAEVKMYSKFGDLIGMTLASEATLAKELGCGYAGICQVDNLAHGLGDKELDFQSIKKAAKSNSADVERIIEKLVGG